MAKEQFTRSKPHMNVLLEPRLIERGFTTHGAFQIAHGLMVTDLKDRQLIAEILAEKHHLHEHIAFTYSRVHPF